MASASSFRSVQDTAAAGSLTVTASDGMICVTGIGFFSDACVEQHFEDLRQVALMTRPRHPRLKVIIDMRASLVQSTSTSARIERETRRIWARDDRIAIVARAGLTRMQLSRIVDSKNHRTFETIDAARQWLDAG
jgi:hypothetical protein